MHACALHKNTTDQKIAAHRRRNDRQLISGTSTATNQPNLHYVSGPSYRAVGHWYLLLGRGTHISYVSLSDQLEIAQRNAASDLFMMRIL